MLNDNKQVCDNDTKLLYIYIYNNILYTILLQENCILLVTQSIDNSKKLLVNHVYQQIIWPKIDQ